MAKGKKINLNSHDDNNGRLIYKTEIKLDPTSLINPRGPGLQYTTNSVFNCFAFPLKTLTDTLLTLKAKGTQNRGTKE